MTTHTAGDPMTAEQVLDVVRRAIVRVLELDPAVITLATSFKADLAADSLALVEIIELVEEELAAFAPAHFHIADEDLDALTTVGDAVDYALAQL